jgi:hypothetical protein
MNRAIEMARLFVWLFITLIPCALGLATYLFYFASAMGKNIALSVPACKGFFLTSIDFAL